jgi:hypothetical protein
MDHKRANPESPLVVAYGLGVNSTAMLVEFANRGITPDLILFADTGGEKPETYAYLPIIQRYLKEVDLPEVVTVRYEPKWAVYHTLEGQCLHTGTLPSLAYGGKSCSLKYKRYVELVVMLIHRSDSQRNSRSRRPTLHNFRELPARQGCPGLCATCPASIHAHPPRTSPMPWSSSPSRFRYSGWS